MARRATNVTRARIQEIALALFSTRGYEATSLQEIAAALDVTKAALYYHFPSKAALLQSLADPFLDAEQALLDGYGAGPLTAAARRALVRALADLLLELSAHRGLAGAGYHRCCPAGNRGAGRRARGARPAPPGRMHADGAARVRALPPWGP